MTGAAYAPHLSDGDVAAFDADAVPHYLRFFDALLGNTIVPRPGARAVVFACRTASAHAELAARLASGDSLVGVDGSEPAIWSARLRQGREGLSLAYEHAATTDTSLDEEAYTHALALHPLGGPEQRAALFAEMRRVLEPGGQVLLAMPVRGSFPEILDLVREFALKHDKPNVAAAADRAVEARVSIETLSDDLERAGFVGVDVDVQLLAVPFESGKAFARSAVARLVVGPDVAALLDGVELPLRERAVAYAAEAVGKYWSESKFELAVNIGGASGWAPGEPPRHSAPPSLLRV